MATEKITINVTEYDIKTGERSNAESCMIAQAIRRELDLAEHVVVSVVDAADGITIESPIQDIEIELSLADAALADSINSKIDAFDKDESVEPFTIEFEVPVGWRESL